MREHKIVQNQGIGMSGATPLISVYLEFQLPRSSSRVGSCNGAQIYTKGLPGIGCSQLVINGRLYDLGATKIIVRPRLNDELDVRSLAALGIEGQHIVCW